MGVTDVLNAALDGFTAAAGVEADDVARLRRVAADGDPFPRTTPVHVTGSAVIVHPPTGRVLLRWHDRMGSWLQVGGHADPGEVDPEVVARREAEEETGLTDLAPWPDLARPWLVHVVIVAVPAANGEPDHEHADLRYVLATAEPDKVRPESPSARLRWLSPGEALDLVAEDNLHTTLTRVAARLAPAP